MSVTVTDVNGILQTALGALPSILALMRGFHATAQVMIAVRAGRGWQIAGGAQYGTHQHLTGKVSLLWSGA
jgi:hypothetical protein